MRKVVLCGYVLILCLITVPTVQAEPFAPKAEVSPDMLEKKHPAYMNAMQLQRSKMPSAEEVGIPAYPGAVSVLAVPMSTISMSGKVYKVLPRVVVVAPESPEEVLAFYRKELPDWQHGDFYGAGHLWNGEEEYDPMKTDSSMERIVIQAPRGHLKKLVPNAKSRIEIYYTP